MREEKHYSVQFEIDKPDLQSWFENFSTHIDASKKEGYTELPPAFATGFAKVKQVEEGYAYRIADYTLNNDFIYKTAPSANSFLFIYFYKYSSLQFLYYKADDELVVDSREPRFSSLLLTNSQVSEELRVSKGTHVQGLTIQLSRQWIQDNVASPNEALQKFFFEKKVFQALLYPKAQKLMDELFDKTVEKLIPGLYTTNRVSRLLESFLKKILKNEYSVNVLPPSKKDVENLLRVENYLCKNYRAGFPGIEKLAQLAFMSQTKLKKDFKNAYGKPLYEYFQNHRMHKAKEYLASGNYSVAEAAIEVGYRNLSNFSTAFKKQFNYLPKDFLKLP